MPQVDLVKVLGIIHRVELEAEKEPDKEKKEHMQYLTTSALSALVLYLRVSNPVMQDKHYKAIERLEAEYG